jgi:PAS domain S-box-containing protein
MKRLFYGMIAGFIVISVIGITLTGFYLYNVGNEMSLLIDSNLSLVSRSELSMEIENLRTAQFVEPENQTKKAGILNKVDSYLARCGVCHHGSKGDEKIDEMTSLIKSMKENSNSNNVFSELVDDLQSLSNDTLFSGQKLVSDRSSASLDKMRIGWMIFITSTIILIGSVILITVLFMRKFDKNLRNIVHATDAIRRGEKISSGKFVDELRQIGDSMEMMQSELLIKEEKLIYWAKRWQTAFDSVDSMMALCDIDGTVIIVNNAFYGVFKTGEDLEGKSVNEVVCIDKESYDECAIAKTLKDGNIHSETIKYDNIILSVKTFPVVSEGNDITGVLWIGRDITKEKELEERAIQSEKLVALGELVAGIAHEINNPLSAVVGFSEILKDSNDLSKEDSQRIEKIYSAALRVAKIIRNLLEFSRKKPSEFRRHNLNEIVDKIIELTEYELHVDNVEVRKEFSETPSIWCDVTQMQQVILNIINNAHHAITEKGEKGIISLKTYSDDEKVYLEISDTGVGIPEIVINRIYEPFFTTKDVGKGTGLGLSIVYSAVKAHGGDIKVSSITGEGSTFIVSIPVDSHPHSS